MKCKYATECPLYQDTGQTCNNDPSGYCGKYREFEENRLK